MYSSKELQQLHSDGKAYETGGGQVIPTASPGDVLTAAVRAKAAEGSGFDEDDPGLRAHVAARAAAHGMQAMVPHSWTAGQPVAAKSRAIAKAAGYQRMADIASDPAARAGYEELARLELAKAGAPVSSPGALAKAAGYGRMAGTMTNQAEAAACDLLARQELARAGAAR